ncbi:MULTISPECIES: hypothetical protein [Stenotrophomonas]|jgi:hypothetical protein|uniref:Uncharacterized protein n=1 Tax=Stenotrophomonas aracearum TaxID=3003272 RepID=A0ABY9YDK6_9GAMM|nr:MULTISPECIES: hypothetical protein [unclassified Stenotrophomonas]RRU16124.1 hypothetical protein EGJ34_08220 [Stenotrophomonas sp. 278]WNH48500.1 hypothetical protein PDM28_17855 [Stenotrophomonas sp. A5588]
MPFFLVCTDLDFTIELGLTEDAQKRMQWQLLRLQDEGNLAAFGSKLSTELSKAFPELIDWDLKAPTPAQFALAKSLSLQFAMDIPQAARESRSEMHKFIAEQSARIRAKKAT